MPAQGDSIPIMLTGIQLISSQAYHITLRLDYSVNDILASTFSDNGQVDINKDDKFTKLAIY